MRRLAWIAPLLLLGLSACGSGGDAQRFSLTTPGTDDLIVREVEGSEKPRRGKPTRAEVSVIRGWADALRAGKVNEAARFFAVPTVVLDGTNPQRTLPNMKAVRNFNRGLPCGAKLGKSSSRPTVSARSSGCGVRRTPRMSAPNAWARRAVSWPIRP
jgi:hypothetical protein